MEYARSIYTVLPILLNSFKKKLKKAMRVILNLIKTGKEFMKFGEQ